MSWLRRLWPLLLCAGCASTPAAREVADVSGFKAEIAAVQNHIRDIEATTNYDTDVWTNRGLLLVPIALSWLWVRRLRNGSGKRSLVTSSRACAPPVFDEKGTP